MSYSKTNEAIKRNSGKVGNIRYYVKAGKTYSRSASADVSNPRTLSQMAVLGIVKAGFVSALDCTIVQASLIAFGWHKHSKSKSVVNNLW